MHFFSSFKLFLAFPTAEKQEKKTNPKLGPLLCLVRGSLRDFRLCFFIRRMVRFLMAAPASESIC